MYHGDLLSMDRSVAFGAGEVEDDLLRLVVQFLFDGDMSVKELAGDVGKYRGAARRDAALGHQK